MTAGACLLLLITALPSSRASAQILLPETDADCLAVDLALSAPEQWALDRLCNGQIADFKERDEELGAEPPPETWPRTAEAGIDTQARRTLGKDFLEAITAPAHLRLLGASGIRIDGAVIEGDVEIHHAQLAGHFWLLNSQVKGNLHLSDVEVAETISFAGSAFGGYLSFWLVDAKRISFSKKGNTELRVLDTPHGTTKFDALVNLQMVTSEKLFEIEGANFADRLFLDTLYVGGAFDLKDTEFSSNNEGKASLDLRNSVIIGKISLENISATFISFMSSIMIADVFINLDTITKLRLAHLYSQGDFNVTVKRGFASSLCPIGKMIDNYNFAGQQWHVVGKVTIAIRGFERGSDRMALRPCLLYTNIRSEGDFHVDASPFRRLEGQNLRIGGNLSISGTVPETLQQDYYFDCLRPVESQGVIILEYVRTPRRLSVSDVKSCLLSLGAASADQIGFSNLHFSSETPTDDATENWQILVQSATANRSIQLDGVRGEPRIKIASTQLSHLTITKSSFGLLELNEASIGQTIDFGDDTLPDSTRFAAINSNVGVPPNPLANWPKDIRLVNVDYGIIEDLDSITVGDWLRWLEKGYNPERSHDPDNHKKIADTLESAGFSGEADRIRFDSKAKIKEETWHDIWNKPMSEINGNSLWRWLTLSLQENLVGYGFRFYYSFFCVFFIVVGAATVKILERRQRPKDQEVRWGLAFLYSLDMLLPVIRLREGHYQDHFLKSKVARIYFIFHSLFGYVLGLYLVAALTGITK